MKRKPEMKRKLIAVLLVLALTAAAVPVSAGQDDGKLEGNRLAVFVEPEPGEENAYGLRGFTASPDGSRLFLGYLHGPYGDRGHVSVYDGVKGEKIGEIMPAIGDDIPVGKSNYYPKGLAVDNRGFLFVGLTHAETPYISIFCYDNYLNEIGHVWEELDDVTGINGIATYKSGDSILLYVLTCYNSDTLRCYDVTDPTDMKLYSAFGDNGIVDYNALSGSSRDPGYIAVDVDGCIYITCLKSANDSLRKGSHVLKLSPDGRQILAETEINEAYGICTAGDYLFVSTYNYEDSEVTVLNRSDLSEAGILRPESQSWPLTDICYGGEHLYVADQGEEMKGDAGRVLRTANALNITRDARETEKMDPGKYETVPTAVPSETDDGASGNSGGSGAGVVRTVILSVCALVLAAGIALVVLKLRKKKAA